MANLFRKILIRLGKIIPFVLAFILLVGYIESIYAVISQNLIVDVEDETLYNLPITFFLSDIVFIDWLDVFLVWILCFALELCKYAFRCAYLITLNLPFRRLVAHVSMADGITISLYAIMALFGLFCVYGGFKMIPQQKGKF